MNTTLTDAPTPAVSAAPARTFARFATGWPAAIALTLVMLAVALAAASHWCATFDETYHLAAGHAYWTEPDGFRLNPENGCFPQRWAAIPSLLSKPNKPDHGADGWRTASSASVGYEMLYDSGNDPAGLLWQGRAMIGLLMAGTGLVVYAWGRKLHGAAGGMLALVLFMLCPVVLSNGVLITSDTAAMFAFTLAVAALWWMLQRITPVRVLAAGGSIGLLAVAKMSAPLIVPMAALMIAARLAWGERAAGVSRGRELARILAACAGVALVAVVVIWAFYGFRFAMIPPELAGQVQLPGKGWGPIEASPKLTARLVVWARDHKVLPEGFLFGYGYVVEFLQRQAYADGLTWYGGQWWYFPYAMLVKTPPAALAVGGLAIVAALMAIRTGGRAAMKRAYPFVPLAALLAVYWPVAMTSPMNLGVRHLLPTFPAMFIFFGGAVALLAGKTRSLELVIGVLIAWLAVDVAMVYPSTLAYISPAFGGPAKGHLRLVDSSYDWGQALPQLKEWLAAHPEEAKGRPVPLIYFGMGKARAHGIDAKYVWSFPESPERARVIAPLEPGLYAVSATMLQGCYLFPLGPWTQTSEDEYRRLQLERRAFIDRIKAGNPPTAEEQQTKWRPLLDQYDQYRAARLCALLRTKQPVGHAGYAIKVFDVSEKETQQAEFGALGK